jgi:hydroxymethylpyrimidine kinase/phosphomethylpyrimidine kinase/thiamine-phosphate diphosphorylase
MQKKYIEKAIGANLDLGEGSGPMAHFVTEL